MATKTVYIFNNATGAYLSNYEAQESPLEPGVYIEPVSSTDILPPIAGANQVAVFAAGVWSLNPDYRGQTIYKQADGTSQEVTAIGSIPSGYALNPPPPTLAQTQVTQSAAMDAAYQGAIFANINYMGATFQGDATTQQTLSYALAGGLTFAPPAWYDITNSPIAMTYAQLQAFAGAMIDRGNLAYVNKQVKKAAIRAATTVTAVNAVIF